MMITGNNVGNLLGILYFLAFQFCGLILAAGIFKIESKAIIFLSGSVFGSVMLQWFPLLFAFFFGFTMISHIMALVVAAFLAVFALFKLKPNRPTKFPKISAMYIIPMLIFLFFCFLVINGFRLENNILYSSQCTYGDMSMHLGFITSIAQQGVFPPKYSILAGTELAYPFLGDSISSSIYIFGSSLKLAYVLPMLFAGAQVFVAFLIFMKMWLKSTGKVVLAFILFFVNGGLGFFYFVSGSANNFTRIFTAFYETPTNLIGENIRWVNTIVDMMVPQRATLFGWSVLFTAIVFLYKAVHEKKKKYFLVIGVLAGALPMIHTHSFLAFALIAFTWLIIELCKSATKFIAVLFVSFPIAMAILQCFIGNNKSQKNLLRVVIAVFVFLLAVVIYQLIRLKDSGKLHEILSTWGIFLVITLVLALPQLIAWTFKQAAGEQFTRGYFNWGNLSDNYLWFYIKNIGVPALLFIPAILWAGKERLRVIAPALLIWIVAELVVFQPNEYDNNKLLYVGFLFVSGLIADYLVTLYKKLDGIKGRNILGALVLFFCTVSGILTMGRESVAEYELMSSNEINAEQYIESVSEPTDVILTNLRHNNAIAALSGRNIVCGSESYVFFHGLDSGVRHTDIQNMYEYPLESAEIFERNAIKYIILGSYERDSYNVDESGIESLFHCVFESGDVRIFKVKED